MPERSGTEAVPVWAGSRIERRAPIGSALLSGAWGESRVFISRF